jgi:hypothetical protein
MIGTVGRIVDLKAAQFNGTDEYAYVDNPSFKADTIGAFSLWFRAATLLGANGAKTILGYGVKDAGNNAQWNLRQRRSAVTSNQNRFSVVARPTHNGTVSTVNGGTSMAATTWYHVVFQSNGTGWNVYVNGVAETLSVEGGSDTGDWLGDLSGSDHRLSFAANFIANASSGYNDCRQNEIGYVSGRVLTAGEITSLYNSGTPLGYRRTKAAIGTDLVSHWSMGDRGDSATTIVDRIGSNHLTLVNMDASNYVTP